MDADYQYLYIGSYTAGDAPGCSQEDECGAGIYFFNRQEDGLWNWSLTENAREIGRDVFPAYNPSYMEFDQNKEYLYSVEEAEDHGAVLCYQVMADGKLEFLERYYFRGGASCHIMITSDNRYLIVSDYIGGLITVFERMKQGSLHFVRQEQHESFAEDDCKGKNKLRQERPHAHSTMELPDGRILTADLGRDELTVTERITSEVDGTELTIWHTDTPWKLPAGCGPRHMALHPNGRWLYVLTELSGEVLVLDVEKKGKLLCRRSLRLRASGREFSGEGIIDEQNENASADLHISEDGRHLYASNRGLDSIVIFEICDTDGRLTLQSVYPCGGRDPRSFAITREHIVIANQTSGNVVIYRLNPGGNIGLPVGEIYVPKAVKVLLR